MRSRVVLLAVFLAAGPPLSALAAEQASALQALQLAPVTNVRRLIDLGCRDVLTVTTQIKPIAETRGNANLFREYQYRGLSFGTETDQYEIIFGAGLPASAFQAWGILDRGAALADMIGKFGEPEKAPGGAFAFVSSHDERAAVVARHDGANITRLEWHCR